MLTLARTLEGEKESVIATRDRSDGQREMSYVTKKCQGKRSVGKPGGPTRRSGCFNCGHTDHFQWACPLREKKREFSGQSCEGCGQGERSPKDKYKSQRPTTKPKKGPQKKVAQAEQASSTRTDSDTSGQDIESVVKDVFCAEVGQSSDKKLLVSVRVKKQSIPFKVDTGADVSLMDEVSWEQLGQSRLSEAKKYLRNASGKLMILKRVFTATTSYCSHSTLIQFYIRYGQGSNLLGMDWVKVIGLSQVFGSFLKSLDKSDFYQRKRPKK